MDASDLGPLGPVAGYGTAIVAAGNFLLTAWFGRYRTWMANSVELDFENRRVATLATAIGVVTLWLTTDPGTIFRILVFALVSGVVTLVCWAQFRSMVRRHRYTIIEARKDNDSVERNVLGGDFLTEEARILKATGAQTNEQDMLPGFQYQLDRVWTRESIDRISQRVTLLFVGMMISGTLVLTALGFIVQVRLTGKPVANVINVEDAPGLSQPNPPPMQKKQ